MKHIKNTLLLFIALAASAYSSCIAQIKNTKSETVKIYGNCSMCKTTIETAGNVKKSAKVNWDKDTKMAIITYDSIKTNQDEILKRIALAGYDSNKYLAPNEAYSKLDGCCQYERVNKVAPPKTEATTNHTMHNSKTMAEPKHEVNQLKWVFDNYFALKDALVKSDGKLVSSLAKDLLKTINDVKMNKLSSEEHTVWMQVMKDLISDARYINEAKEIEQQRKHFITLSDNMYKLIKVTNQESPIYFQHCPMANDGKGANWLSKESGIKNPYYGSMMLTCGKTVETIK